MVFVLSINFPLSRNDDPDHITRVVVNDLGPTWDRGYSVDDVIMYFTSWGSNVFTKEVLQAIENAESEIFCLSDYQTKFCQLDEQHNCVKANSVIRYFDGTYSHISPVFYDPEYNNVTTVIHTAYTHPDTREDFLYFLGKGYVITEDAVFADLTRSSTPMGWPLEGNSSTETKREELEQFLLDDVQDALKAAQELYSETVEMCYFSRWLFELTILQQTMRDLLLAVGSLLFIFCFLLQLLPEAERIETFTPSSWHKVEQLDIL